MPGILKINSKKIYNAGISIPVILGDSVNALGLVRSFSIGRVFSIVTDCQKDVAAFSRYSTYLKCPDPLSCSDGLMDSLRRIAGKLKAKGFLIPTSDPYLLFAGEYREQLERCFYLPFPGKEKIDNLINKQNLYRMAMKIGIPCPKNEVIGNIHQIDNAGERIGFPFILKPSLPIGFKEAFGEKALFIKNAEVLEKQKKNIENSDFRDREMIIQEYIPGGTENLYTISSYASESSKIMGYSIGHKIRQSPPDTGTIISGKVTHVQDLFEYGQSLIQYSGYYGISNIEFKKDSRDNSFKLIEMNPRPGVWNFSATASGINLPMIAYKDFYGQTNEVQQKTEKEIIWMITPVDCYLSLFGFKKMGYPEYSLSMSDWWKSIKGEKNDAVFNWTDPLPFVFLLLKYFSKLIKIKKKKGAFLRADENTNRGKSN